MARPIGILGGTFDPVHNGHVILATLAAETLGLDPLFVVPALRSPHKPAGPAAPPEVRLALLESAFAAVPSVSVSDVEIRRPPPSYTVDTIDAMRQAHPGREIVLLLGLDALADFPRWRDVAGIARACRLAVFRRPGRDASLAAEVARTVGGLRLQVLDTPAIEISSTQVRSRAAAGLPLAGFVPDAVAATIAKLRLYARGD
jgi:nicotinate-nucleotide adenylyltransferase